MSISGNVWLAQRNEVLIEFEGNAFIPGHLKLDKLETIKLKTLNIVLFLLIRSIILILHKFNINFQMCI